MHKVLKLLPHRLDIFRGVKVEVAPEFAPRRPPEPENEKHRSGDHAKKTWKLNVYSQFQDRVASVLIGNHG